MSALVPPRPIICPICKYNLQDIPADKDKAYEVFSQSTTIEEKVYALWMVIKEHYIREELNNGPDLITFARHWLWAQHEGWAMIPPKIIKHLAQEFPLTENPRIGTGRSQWGTEKRGYVGNKIP